MTGPLVVVGDSLLDRDVEGRVDRVCPDAPAPVLAESDVRSRPGGAALAARLAASAWTGETVLVTPLCADAAALELLGVVGVEVVGMPASGATPEKIRMRSGGQSLMRLDRGGITGVGDPPNQVRPLLQSAAAVLVSDYGGGVTANRLLRGWLQPARPPVVWDPHPRGGDPVPGCRLVTPNTAELGVPDGSLASIAGVARDALERWSAHGVAVTRGSRGALLVSGDGPPIAVPTEPVAGDTCGAGDCFAAAAAVGLAQGALPSEAVSAAVAAASAYVAGHAPAPVSLPEVVRRRGGTVVATGGCFDILHAGHLSLLKSARSLGDCLIVCLNSDRSVRRLKGPGRPVVSQEERAALLASLECVDSVHIFDEDTPAQVLESLRPDIWVKGGDYDARTLPEAETLARWGGQAVTVPYLKGHSTTSLLQRAHAR